jgi:hypothetical protein
LKRAVAIWLSCVLNHTFALQEGFKNDALASWKRNYDGTFDENRFITPDMTEVPLEDGQVSAVQFSSK